MTVYHHTEINSPIGSLRLVAEDDHLTGLFMEHHNGKDGFPPLHSDSVRTPNWPVLKLATEELTTYFAGKLHCFKTPHAGHGTAFEKTVWQALCRIPLGRTESYGALAKRIGKPGAARAVGMANGRNPISIIVPCHRVIGADGSLTGYGGGLPRKTWLLTHEAKMAASRAAA